VRHRWPGLSAFRYALSATLARRVPLCAHGNPAQTHFAMRGQQSSVRAFRYALPAALAKPLQPQRSVLCYALTVALAKRLQSPLGVFCFSGAVVVLGLLVSWWCTVQEVQVF